MPDLIYSEISNNKPKHKISNTNTYIFHSYTAQTQVSNQIRNEAKGPMKLFNYTLILLIKCINREFTLIA